MFASFRLTRRPVPFWCTLLVSGLCLIISGCSTAQPAVPKADERLAYCLDPARWTALAGVAIRLDSTKQATAPDRIMSNGADIRVDEWRGAEFDRACDALMAATGHKTATVPTPITPNWVTTLVTTASSIVLLLIGAGVTLFTGGLREAGTRRRLRAGQLRTATDSFVAACEAYADAHAGNRQPGPLAQPVRDRRRELLGKLREIRAVYRDKIDIDPAVTMLKADLGEQVLRDWELVDDKQPKLDKLSADLECLVNRSEAINVWLERTLLARLGGTK